MGFTRLKTVLKSMYHFATLFFLRRGFNRDQIPSYEQYVLDLVLNLHLLELKTTMLPAITKRYLPRFSFCKQRPGNLMDNHSLGISTYSIQHHDAASGEHRARYYSRTMFLPPSVTNSMRGGCTRCRGPVHPAFYQDPKPTFSAWLHLEN